MYQGWLMHLVPRHPHGRPRFYFCLLALVWPSLGCWGHLESTAVIRNPHLCPLSVSSLSFWLSNTLFRNGHTLNNLQKNALEKSTLWKNRRDEWLLEIEAGELAPKGCESLIEQGEESVSIWWYCLPPSLPFPLPPSLLSISWFDDIEHNCIQLSKFKDLVN